MVKAVTKVAVGKMQDGSDLFRPTQWVRCCLIQVLSLPLQNLTLNLLDKQRNLDFILKNGINLIHYFKKFICFILDYE